MIKVFFVVAITILVSTSYGLLLTKILNIKENGYTAPLGFAGLLFTLQILYYPVQLFNLSSFYIHLSSFIVYGILIFYSFFHINTIIKQYFNIKTHLVLFTVLFFIFVFFNVSISIPRADGQMYLNYISQNVDIEYLNNFNLWTGLKGEEFVTIYLFQGYYHFASFLIKFVNIFSSVFGIGSKIDSMIVSLWGLGTTYSLISSFFILNVTNYFRYKNSYIPKILAFFALFYTNFYYWKVSFSFYGNTWRSLFMAMMMFYLYRLIKEEEKNYLFVSAIVFGASLSASSSSLFIGFSILFGIAYHFFKTNNPTAFEDTSYIGLPMVIYVLAITYKDHFRIFLVLSAISVLYYSLHRLNYFRPYFLKFNNFISKHVTLIFIIIIPIIAISYSFIDIALNPEYPWNLFHYFNNHAAYDMVKNYLFLHSNWVDNVLNLFRWTSILILLYKYKNIKGYDYILNHFVILAVLFLNPLATSFISRMFASNVYYRAYESLFNVFTETLLFGLLLNEIWNNKLIRTLVSVTLVVIVVLSHYESLSLKDPASLYGFYIKDGENVLPIYKIKNSELDIIKAFEIESNNFNKTDKQITVVSHVDGLRVFMPDIYQVFTARQYWSTWDRIDQDFYQVARMWYGWEEKPENLDFTKSCAYLIKYEIDYVLNEVWENNQFDLAINSCTEIIYENYEYKLRKVIK